MRERRASARGTRRRRGKYGRHRPPPPPPPPPEDTRWNTLRQQILNLHEKRLADVEAEAKKEPAKIKAKKASAKESAMKCIKELLDAMWTYHKNAIDNHNILINDMETLIDEKKKALKESQEEAMDRLIVFSLRC
jgi:hypothetical protein